MLSLYSQCEYPNHAMEVRTLTANLDRGFTVRELDGILTPDA